MEHNELNRILHQPIRTRIMAYLIANDAGDYTTLKKEFNISDGHMTTHMRELVEHNYVSVHKSFVDNKPRTTYTPTQTGKEAFKEYINVLKKIILYDE